MTDPFGPDHTDVLLSCFPDLMRPFKQHYVTDLSRSLDTVLTSHHRRNVQQARRKLTVEHCPAPLDFANDWVRLYRNLVARHHIRGPARFSPQSLTKQLSVPGLEAFRARYNDETIGMVLWYVQREVAYYHLAAYSNVGYELGASFALFAESHAYFASRAAWLNLGAAPGLTSDSTSGLARFKAGWSTGVRTAYLCGRIFDRRRYRELAAATPGPLGYFPAYRHPEAT